VGPLPQNTFSFLYINKATTAESIQSDEKSSYKADQNKNKKALGKPKLATKFLDKEYILILRRYQLHLASATTHCSNDNTDSHSQKKKKNYRKRKRPATVINSL
jgi:hypothetical protein